MSILNKWKALSAPVRALVVTFGSADVAARIAAVRDLLKRDGDEVRGPKLLWLVLLAVVNSGGILPMVYRRFAVKTA